MINFLRLTTVVAVTGLGLGACVTSQSAAGLDPEHVMIAKNVMSEMCMLTQTRGGNVKKERLKLDEIYVSRLKKLTGGGYEGSVYHQGRSTNVYFNLEDATGNCGNNIQKGYPSEYLAAYLAKQGKTPLDANAETRPIAVSWEGYTELFSGTIEETGGGVRGKVNVMLPNNDGQCTGAYQATSRTQGTWNIACTNDLVASGTFTAFGDGKGASGTGTDKQGRTVTYTVGGRI